MLMNSRVMVMVPSLSSWMSEVAGEGTRARICSTICVLPWLQLLKVKMQLGSNIGDVASKHSKEMLKTSVKLVISIDVRTLLNWHLGKERNAMTLEEKELRAGQDLPRIEHVGGSVQYITSIRRYLVCE